MWDQLTTVKKSKGQLGVLVTCRALYRGTAEEGFDMVEHISGLLKLQEEFHIMNKIVTDNNFLIILVTSLPESWTTIHSIFWEQAGPKQHSNHMNSLLYYWRRTDTEKAETCIPPSPHFRPRERPNQKTLKRSVAIVTRKDISQRIVGIREEAERVKDLRARDDQTKEIGQIKLKKLI